MIRQRLLDRIYKYIDDAANRGAQGYDEIICCLTMNELNYIRSFKRILMQSLDDSNIAYVVDPDYEEMVPGIKPTLLLPGICTITLVTFNHYSTKLYKYKRNLAMTELLNTFGLQAFLVKLEIFSCYRYTVYEYERLTIPKMVREEEAYLFGNNPGITIVSRNTYYDLLKKNRRVPFVYVDAIQKKFQLAEIEGKGKARNKASDENIEEKRRLEEEKRRLEEEKKRLEEKERKLEEEERRRRLEEERRRLKEENQSNLQPGCSYCKRNIPSNSMQNRNSSNQSKEPGKSKKSDGKYRNPIYLDDSLGFKSDSSVSNVSGKVLSLDTYVQEDPKSSSIWPHHQHSEQNPDVPDCEGNMFTTSIQASQDGSKSTLKSDCYTGEQLYIQPTADGNQTATRDTVICTAHVLKETEPQSSNLPEEIHQQPRSEQAAHTQSAETLSNHNNPHHTSQDLYRGKNPENRVQNSRNPRHHGLEHREPPHHVLVHRDPPNQYPDHHDSVRRDLSYQASGHYNPQYYYPAHHDPLQYDPVHRDSKHHDLLHRDPSCKDLLQHYDNKDPLHHDTVSGNPIQHDPVHQVPGHNVMVHRDSPYQDSGYHNPDHKDPVHRNPPHHYPRQHDKIHRDPPSHVPGHHVLVHRNPPFQDSGHHDPIHRVSSLKYPVQHDPIQLYPLHHDLIQHDTSHPDPGHHVLVHGNPPCQYSGHHDSVHRDPSYQNAGHCNPPYHDSVHVPALQVPSQHGQDHRITVDSVPGLHVPVQHDQDHRVTVDSVPGLHVPVQRDQDHRVTVDSVPGLHVPVQHDQDHRVTVDSVPGLHVPVQDDQDHRVTVDSVPGLHVPVHYNTNRHDLGRAIALSRVNISTDRDPNKVQNSPRSDFRGNNPSEPTNSESGHEIVLRSLTEQEYEESIYTGNPGETRYETTTNSEKTYTPMERSSQARPYREPDDGVKHPHYMPSITGNLEVPPNYLSTSVEPEILEGQSQAFLDYETAVHILDTANKLLASENTHNIEPHSLEQETVNLSLNPNDPSLASIKFSKPYEEPEDGLKDPHFVPALLQEIKLFQNEDISVESDQGLKDLPETENAADSQINMQTQSDQQGRLENEEYSQNSEQRSPSTYQELPCEFTEPSIRYPLQKPSEKFETAYAPNTTRENTKAVSGYNVPHFKSEHSYFNRCKDTSRIDENTCSRIHQNVGSLHQKSEYKASTSQSRELSANTEVPANTTIDSISTLIGNEIRKSIKAIEETDESVIKKNTELINRGAANIQLPDMIESLEANISLSTAQGTSGSVAQRTPVSEAGRILLGADNKPKLRKTLDKKKIKSSTRSIRETLTNETPEDEVEIRSDVGSLENIILPKETESSKLSNNAKGASSLAVQSTSSKQISKDNSNVEGSNQSISSSYPSSGGPKRMSDPDEALCNRGAASKVRRKTLEHKKGTDRTKSKCRRALVSKRSRSYRAAKNQMSSLNPLSVQTESNSSLQNNIPFSQNTLTSAVQPSPQSQTSSFVYEPQNLFLQQHSSQILPPAQQTFQQQHQIIPIIDMSGTPAPQDVEQRPITYPSIIFQPISQQPYSQHSMSSPDEQFHGNNQSSHGPPQDSYSPLTIIDPNILTMPYHVGQVSPVTLLNYYTIPSVPQPQSSLTSPGSSISFSQTSPLPRVESQTQTYSQLITVPGQLHSSLTEQLHELSTSEKEENLPSENEPPYFPQE